MSHYHLPYRGLPSEIRLEIWRYCLIKDVEVHGPYRKLIPEDPQVMKDHSNLKSKIWDHFSKSTSRDDGSDTSLFKLHGGPNLAVLQLNKEVHQEARDLIFNRGIFYDVRNLSKNAEIAFFKWLAPARIDCKSTARDDGRSTSACGFAARIRPDELLEHYWMRVQDRQYRKPDALSIGSWLKYMSRYGGIKRLLCELDIDDEPNGFADGYENPFEIRDEEIFEYNHDGSRVDESVSYSQMIEVLQFHLDRFWDISDAKFALGLFERGSLETLEIIFSGIHHPMKMAVHDGGKALLQFDQLRDENTLTERFHFEAVTYNQPDTVHIIIKIRKGHKEIGKDV